MNTIPSWIEQLAVPFPDGPAGLDLRYQDDFAAVKQQIEKLSDIDFEFVRTQSKKMLLEKTKDLRVAGYFTLAAAYLDGLPGVAEGLHTFTSLINHFWLDLHPQRVDARLAALQWLNNPRLAAFITGREYQSVQEIDQLQQALETLNASIKAQVTDAPKILGGIEFWLTQQKEKFNTIDTKPAPAPRAADPVSAPPLLGSIHDIERISKEIIYYFQRQNALLQASAYARALRWSDMCLPPHNNHQTKMSPPRAAGMAQLEQLLTARKSSGYLSSLRRHVP